MIVSADKWLINAKLFSGYNWIKNKLIQKHKMHVKLVLI